MNKRLRQIWSEQDGVLSFEWVLLLTLLVIGIISGLAGARDAMIDELADTAEAVVSFDQSFSFEGVPELGILPSEFVDEPGEVNRCDRGP